MTSTYNTCNIYTLYSISVTSSEAVLLGFITDSEETMLMNTLSPFSPFTILHVLATKHAFGLLAEPSGIKVVRDQQEKRFSIMISIYISKGDRHSEDHT